jgi:acetylornithine deacetylase/succinyl-diaminopimelate desuccinylase-like protein
LKEPDETAQRTEIPWDRLDAEWNDEWRIFARSASDSKGPNIQFLAALDAMGQAGFTPDFNIKVIVDTEEELGSPHLQEALVSYREALVADWLVILDGPPHVSNRPTLKFGARGIATFTLTTYGPRVPQHSGHYGNYVPNPALRLAQILASMKDQAGRVTIPGFYDGVSLDSATMAVLNRVPDDERVIRETLGIATTDSVAGSLQEAVQYPSLNVRGMSSGWVGDQRRTIVPATATAEVDVRLVLESDPERLLRLVREHIEELGYYVIDRAPTEEERLAHPAMATFTSEVSYGAFRTDFDSEPGRWLTAAMVNLYGEEPIKIRTSGGSIPISPFVATLGLPAVSVPTVNPDNNQHSPNENIRLGNFREGIKVCLAILAQSIESIP